MTAQLDPNWEWIEVVTFDSNRTMWLRGRCYHRRTAQVTSTVTGELLAYLCLSCDSQLPPEWSPDE